jgi:hypothetical protein
VAKLGVFAKNAKREMRIWISDKYQRWWNRMVIVDNPSLRSTVLVHGLKDHSNLIFRISYNPICDQSVWGFYQ